MAAPQAAPAAPKAVVAVDESRVTIEKMSRRRQTIAKRLLEVKQSTAMLTTFNEVDMTNVMALRSRKKNNSLSQLALSLVSCHSSLKQ